MSTEAVYLLGYYARAQTLIELLVQMRLRPISDIREGLGGAYFEQMSDATRRRWLKSLASAEVDSTLGERLESVYAQIAEVRNHISHAPTNLSRNDQDDPFDMKIGSARWIGKPLPSEEKILAAQKRLEWVELWLMWLIYKQESVQPFQKQNGAWEIFAPDRPSLTPPA